MNAGSETWGGSLHLTFRLLPSDKQSSHIRPMLESDGLSSDEILAKLPYESNRAAGGGGDGPDDRRYRDLRHFYQTIGLAYEGEDRRLTVTELGRATLRWLPIITERNAAVLGSHAAYGLSAVQLRNPSRAGSKYSDEMEVFPCAFIWRAMLALDGKISSDELNRQVLATRNSQELEAAISTIKEARRLDDVDLMGPETIGGAKKNDRIVTWISLASFGYTLIEDKNADPERRFYRVRESAMEILEQAVAIRRRHREFPSFRAYVEHISRQSGLPPVLD